ncbi:hypothetical protein BJ508DRAFT_4113 [Ascobolus immersus RN42]|uniref:Cora-domain-containing protein n=1 Tax=Ascobolus immersus RN42 TaxID=1160509 RepID=A0A3N4IPY4_ASCIM|nr:hypothetical protein BJ508DRAFT_4113 [Ascobolus immersus RN42]
MFLVDAPDYLVEKLRKTPLKRLLNPFTVFSLMVTDATNRFEKSIWELRDVIRDQEKNRPAAKISRPDTALYPHLHDLTRHVIHSTEACDSAIAAVEELVHVMKQFIEDYKHEHVNTGIIPNEVFTRMAYNSIRNEKVYLQALRNRSQTLYERLKNEINLTFNLVTQFDSSVSVEIGNSTRKDSNTMTFIGFLTLIFLPATTVATIYGTNTLPLDENNELIRPSKDFWMFWVITFALTICTGLAWLYYRTFWMTDDVLDLLLPKIPQKPEKAETPADDGASFEDKQGVNRMSTRKGTFWSQSRKRTGKSRTATAEIVSDVERGESSY